MKNRWFLLFLRKSLSLRAGRLVIASTCVTLAVALLSAMIAITAGIRGKLGEEIKAYGANIIVTPRNGEYLDKRLVDVVRKMQQVEGVSGQVLGRSFLGGQAVEIIGIEIDTIRNRGWRLTGQWPAKKGEALAGMNVRNALKLVPGNVVGLERSLNGRGPTKEYRITGFIERGGPEDSAVMLSIADAQELLGTEGGLSSVLVRGTPGRLEVVARDIRNGIPGVAVRTIRNIALPEAALLSKVQLLMALVMIVALFAAWVSVSATMGATVHERRTEIGLMKALGATRKEVGLFYRTESTLIGSGGGIAGFLLGILSAEAISKGAFNSFIPVPLYLPFLSLAAGLVMTLSASHAPVNSALNAEAAPILRGE